MPVWTGTLQCDPAPQVVVTPRGRMLTIGSDPVLAPGDALLCRKGGPPFTLAVATRDAEPPPPAHAVHLRPLLPWGGGTYRQMACFGYPDE